MLKNEHSKVMRDEITSHTYKMTYSRINKHVLPFFKKLSIETIHYKEINEFFIYLCSFKYNSVTLSQYLVALKKVFLTAKAHSWINDVPIFPKVKVHKKPRGWFTLNEYKILYKKSIELSQLPTIISPPTHRNKRGGVFTNQQNIPIEFRWLIRFMVNSFIRPVDLKIIQHKHIEIVKGKYNYLRLNLPETKRHIGQTISLPGAVFAYKQLVNYFNQFNLANSENYVFLPEIKDRQVAISIIEKNFRKLLIATNLRFSSNGLKRTLYSLRHSAITYRLLYGKKTDLLSLARNARTSIEMIDKYYASEITAEMKIEHIHS
ncbi:MAG: phage integrase SAM-like domain-containing protein [Betaproteobacteria bacterium]|nr:phage integrase SAM-like domain-containing protein [Betaproteobacteria bacterium]